MKPCPACGREFFWSKKSRARHIDWENQEYRKVLYSRFPALAARFGIKPDGTVSALPRPESPHTPTPGAKGGEL